MKRVRVFSMAVAAAAVVGTTALGAAPAGAAPQSSPKGSSTPLPAVYQYGQNFTTVGNHANCRGNLRYSVSAPKGKRGVVRVTFRSYGFTGDGAAWRKKKSCGLLFSVTKHNGSGIMDSTYFPAHFGPKPGQTVSRDIRIGSGPSIIAASTLLLGSPVMISTSPLGGSTAYTTVP